MKFDNFENYHSQIEGKIIKFVFLKIYKNCEIFFSENFCKNLNFFKNQKMREFF